MNERRIGRFEVHKDLLRDAINTGHGANLFVGSVPLDVQHDWIRRVATFICWNQQFDAIDEGEVVPTYQAVFRHGETSPTWERVA
jgi:hypothetical protein